MCQDCGTTIITVAKALRAQLEKAEEKEEEEEEERKSAPFATVCMLRCIRLGVCLLHNDMHLAVCATTGRKECAPAAACHGTPFSVLSKRVRHLHQIRGFCTCPLRWQQATAFHV